MVINASLESVDTGIVTMKLLAHLRQMMIAALTAMVRAIFLFLIF